MSQVKTFDSMSSPAIARLLALDRRYAELSPEEAALKQAEYEQELAEPTRALEREMHALHLSRMDLDVPGVVVEGRRYRRKDRTVVEYMTLAGPVRVERTVYEIRGGHGGETCVPLELRVGFVDGCWTPVAAEVGCRYMASTSSNEAAKLLKEAGVMAPSTGHLDRLPKHFNELWKRNRAQLFAAVREAEELPDVDDVALIAVSLYGIMLPMKDAPKEAGLGRDDKGPTGYKESACATIDLVDRHGQRLHTIRLGRMPEHKKVTLKELMKAELSGLETLYVSAKFLGIADGAKENWRILKELNLELNLEMELVLDY